VRRKRVFAGHAGWGPGQLDAEVEADGWYVLDAVVDDVFTSRPEGLWSQVLARQGGQLALVARMPVDPSVN
jgi:putative transcriptional regulator